METRKSIHNFKKDEIVPFQVLLIRHRKQNSIGTPFVKLLLEGIRKLGQKNFYKKD